ncbi:heterokaryon incompatibility protein-domain-containing protein [Paraphoma chrysanthemicola]|uniref:Heterokaryon incompatibility protein-domain-containing protein n=1 Tax=Paraphoma chrysanthemicola TaxID=798071 RepID=A0A8K0VXT2_9PLEO|nr:heterokaryon incompatibility protein-domain-containing protein [Paraphoma chrysanthemicola]
MGNLNSRETIRYVFLDVPRAQLRRLAIWNGFEQLVAKFGQGFAQNLQFGRLKPEELQTEPARISHDDSSHEEGVDEPISISPSADFLESDGGSIPQPEDVTSLPPSDTPISPAPQTDDNSETEQSPDPVGSDEARKEDDRVQEINKALEGAIPLPNKTKVEATPEVQPTSVERRDDEEVQDKVFVSSGHTAPKPQPPPGIPLETSPAAKIPDDNYDKDAALRFSSSLMVALPDLGSETRVTRQGTSRIVYNAPPSMVVESTGTNVVTNRSAEIDDATNVRSQEPKARAALKNFLEWDAKAVFYPLRLDPTSIRVAEIHSGALDEEIHVSLRVHRLNDIASRYEALSYTWGPQEPPKFIFVNKIRVPIGQNLHAALQSLRNPEDVRLVWIDGICVNQTSSKECSREVIKMGEIYSLARKVNVFLGDPALSKSTHVKDLFNFLNREIHGQAECDDSQKGSISLQTICEAQGLSAIDVCKGFVEACLQPWWTRVWILQEFYLAKDEPEWYWGKTHTSNENFKRDFSLLMRSSWQLFAAKDANALEIAGLVSRSGRTIDAFKAQVERSFELISRRLETHGFDIPRRLYRELLAQATQSHDFVYGLTHMFDPMFGKVFVPDYGMRKELLFACLAVFLVQFECWGDALWWYPHRFAAGRGQYPSWLPDFTKRIVPHDLDAVPLVMQEKDLKPKLLVLNHRLNAEGYVLDRIYSHRHVHKDKHPNHHHEIFSELWQFDHCMNNNHECHEYYIQGAAPDDTSLQTFLDMYKRYYAKWTHFNSAFQGSLFQSTMKSEYHDRLPRQVLECVPALDVLRWHAYRTEVPGLIEALGDKAKQPGPGCLANIFSIRMSAVFRTAFADFLIGACLFDNDHLSVWLRRFPYAQQWSFKNTAYWSDVSDTSPGNSKKRTQAIMAAYEGYQNDICDEIMRVSWCYSFYYAFLAYVILLDCDDHHALAGRIQRIQSAILELRKAYQSIGTREIESLAAKVPSIAKRYEDLKTVIDLFAGRLLLWTDGGFRGIGCPGTELCCDKKTYVVIVNGLSFPLLVRDLDEKTGEGWIAGFANIRGVDMLGQDADEAELPCDYEKGEKKVFKLR